MPDSNQNAQQIFKGVTTALVTPFLLDDGIDYQSFEALIEQQLRDGVNALLPCGSTGEAATLSHEEHVQVFEFVVKTVAGRVPVLAGTGSNSTDEAIALSKAAQKVGCNGLLLISPYYNKPSQAGIISHYTAVEAAVDLPIILYDIPGRTGVKLELDTVRKLSELSGIQGLKDATGSLDNTSRLRAALGNDFGIFSGDDSLTLPMIAVGADGVISVASHLAPADIIAMVTAALSGDFETARAIHLRLLPLMHGLFVEPNPCPAKYCLARTGLIDHDHVRLPLVQVEKSSRKFLDELLSQFGPTITGNL